MVGGWWLEKGAWIVGLGCRDDRGGRVRPDRWVLLGSGWGRRDDGGGMHGRQAVTDTLADVVRTLSVDRILRAVRESSKGRGERATTGEMQ